MKTGNWSRVNTVKKNNENFLGLKFTTFDLSKIIRLGTVAMFCVAAWPIIAEESNSPITLNGGQSVTINDTLRTGSEPAVTTKNGKNNVTVDYPGKIFTTGEDAYGIYNLGDSNTTLSSVSIQTEADNAYGIYNFGDKNRTTASGSISTGGDGATGILTKGDGRDDSYLDTSSSAAITTNGTLAHGISIEGNKHRSQIAGRITTTGGGSVGILLEGNDNTTTVKGDVSTNAVKYFKPDGKDEYFYAYGIESQGNRNQVTLSETGSVKTSGKWMFGILNKGDDNAITVNGDVITTGSSARAIKSYGNRNTITLNGNITTGVKGIAPNSSSLVDAHGIETSGGDNKIIVSGSITTHSKNSYGIMTKFNLDRGDLDEPIEILLKSGSEVITKGYKSHGIAHFDYDPREARRKITLEKGSSVSTEYNGSVGIYNTHDNDTIIYGDVQTAGNDAYGILNGSGNNTVELYGTIVTGVEGSPTKGKKAYGITNNDNGSDVLIGSTAGNNGTIITYGNESYGIKNECRTAGCKYTINIENGAGIQTSGSDAHGVYIEDNGAETTIAGIISTSGERSFGIYNKGNGNTTVVEEDGTINTGNSGGNDAVGVYNDGDKNTTTVSGEIRTGEEDEINQEINVKSYGVFNNGDANLTTVSSNGQITTWGGSAHAILNEGTNNIATVFGGITTYGLNSAGIWNEPGSSEKTTIALGGKITTTGKNSSGIYNLSQGNESIIAGMIATKGDGAYGIFNLGKGNQNNISGTVVTSGENADGIRNDGDDNLTYINTSDRSVGGVYTSGTESNGVHNIGVGNETTVSGVIITTGTGSSGIYNSGSSNKTVIANNGIIRTSNASAHGVYNFGDNNETFIEGNVNVSGNEAYGIVNNGDGNLVEIAGTVCSGPLCGNSPRIAQTASAALYNEGGSSNTFSLEEGGVIIGSISASNSASKNTFIFDADKSYKFTVGGVAKGTGEGEWVFIDDDGLDPVFKKVNNLNCAAGVTGCYQMEAATLDNLEQNDEITIIDNNALIDSLPLDSNGSSGAGSDPGAASDSGAGSTSGSDKSSSSSSSETLQKLNNTVWANVYGIKTNGEETDARSEFKSLTAGFTIGVPVRTNGGLDWDLLFNISNSRNDLGVTGDQQLTVQSYNFGAVFYDIVPSSSWDLDIFGLIGYNDYNQEREVLNNSVKNGEETLKSSFSGNEILLGFDAEYYKPFNETLDLTFGIKGSLSHEKIKSYSSKYYSWDARKMTQGSIGVSTGVEHRKDALMAYAKLGVDYISLLDGETAGYTISGIERTFKDNDTDDVYGKVNVGFEYNQSENMLFRGNFSGFSSTGGITGYAATLGIEVNF